MNSELHVRYGDLKVYYEPHLDGGGRVFGPDYVPFLSERLGKVGRVYEWCAGPGFIGFSLLAAGFCESLCLSDINPEAVELLRKTVLDNRLEDSVSVYLSDCLDDIPAGEKWDLVVGNPPHSGSDFKLHNWGAPLIYKDLNWELHRRFYFDVGSHLNDDAAVILQENYYCSQPDKFRNMIEAADLHIRSVSPYPPPAQFIYYLWSERNGRTIASSAYEIFSGRDFYFSDPNQRRAEAHFREDGGYSRRPVMATAGEVIDYRGVVLAGDLWTRQQLAGRRLMLRLTGLGKGKWTFEGENEKIRITSPQSDEECDCLVTMPADLFVDIYDHRLSIMAAYAQGYLQIEGDFRLAQAVLCALLNPSGDRRPPGENGRL